MKNTLVVFVALCLALVAGHGDAGNGTPINTGSADTLTLAVYGDWPYGQALFDAAPLLLASINSDPKVRLVLHVGDIHAGTQPCTGAGLVPPPTTSAPGYNQAVFELFEQFKDPVVYTPGDNEWTDCHKSRQLRSGAPMSELAAVRSLFFPDPGYTLGGRKKQVLSQAQAFDPAHPADAQFVENVMWEESRVVFVTLNMPGSNNDGLRWTAPFTDEPARLRDVAERTAADLRWLSRAFALAKTNGAQAVLIALQADMWDPAAVVPGGDGLDGYTAFVHELAGLTLDFGKPVLLVNGDSHLYGADHPLADPHSATGLIHNTQAVPNLTRITVQGSTNTPREWLRLTVDPRSSEVFSWENVVYCDDTTCPQ
jgi:calcineurin-like phosphoesterase family protein